MLKRKLQKYRQRKKNNGAHCEESQIEILRNLIFRSIDILTLNVSDLEHLMFYWSMSYVQCVTHKLNFTSMATDVFITVRKRSLLGQGNVFTRVCHSVHKGRGYDVTFCLWSMFFPRGSLSDAIFLRGCLCLVPCSFGGGVSVMGGGGSLSKFSAFRSMSNVVDGHDAQNELHFYGNRRISFGFFFLRRH